MGRLRLLFLIGPIAWFTLKYLALGSWTWEASTKGGILLNLGVLTIVAAVGTHQAYVDHSQDFLSRWKGAARKTLQYALILPVSLGIWYYGIASDALQSRKQLQKDQVEMQILDDENFEKITAGNPQLLLENRQEIVDRQHANIEIFFSPIFYIGMATMAWSFAGLIVAAIFALIWPKIWAA